MTKIKFSLCFMLLLLCATALANNSNDPSKPIIVNKSSPVFTIKLTANPTTGYSWFLAKYDHHVIKPIKHKYHTPNTKLVGAPGYEEWVFKAKPAAFIAPQITKIQLVYARSWNLKDYKPVTFTIITRDY